MTEPSSSEAAADFLTADYFRELFRRKSASSSAPEVRVVSVEAVARVRGPLQRAVVEVDGRREHFLLKRAAPAAFAASAACASMFRAEALALGDVVPAMEAVLESVQPERHGGGGQLAPRLEDHSPRGAPFVLTEDLSAQGFAPPALRERDDYEGPVMDLEHSVAYAEHLGTFHAASHAVLEMFQAELDAVPPLLDPRLLREANDLLEPAARCAVAMLESWSSFQDFQDRVRRLAAALVPRAAQTTLRPPDTTLKVLSRGDLFLDGVLFRRGAAGLEVRTGDLQLARVGSFAEDLLALEAHVAYAHVERATEAYRVALNGGLRRLGLDARALAPEDVTRAVSALRVPLWVGAANLLPQRGTTAATRRLTRRMLPALLPANAVVLRD